jgi:hypothetical protein
VGSTWIARARAQGYDPKRVVDAPQSFGKLQATITLADMKGAVIGDPNNCSGVRCLKRTLDAEWADVTASVGIIVPPGQNVPKNRKKLLRFLVNGIAKRQDRTMNVAGETLILRPAPKKQTLKAQRVRNRNKPPASGDTRRRTPSFAAQLRSN